jgi:hypothetical protein
VAAEQASLESGLDPQSVFAFGGLTREELAQFEELAGRGPRTLSEDDLSALEALSRWALYGNDDGTLPEFCGAGFCACDGPCVNERDDLTDEQHNWVNKVRRRVWYEQMRRRNLQHGLQPQLVRLPARRDLENMRPRLRDRRVRPRERRARRTRSSSRARAPDDPEPEPPDVTPRRSRGLSSLWSAA